MSNAAHIAHIEHELDGFHQSLALYRQQMNAWYARALDSVSHALDMPSLLGMDRVLRVGDSQQSVSMTDADFSVAALCSQGGELKIESQFESVYDVPIGDIPVEVIRLDDGSSSVIMLDEHGKGSHFCAAGGRYQVRVQGGVSSEQVDALFASYAGLTADLEQWLREQWTGFKPH
ncbi:type IV secretion protein Rhs, partial [Pseudomonas poae]